MATASVTEGFFFSTFNSFFSCGHDGGECTGEYQTALRQLRPTYRYDMLGSPPNGPFT